MNYLAHIYLSGSDLRLQIGNFIGDAVKGDAYKTYPKSIADGILLHRAIDAFTDRQPAIKQTLLSMRPLFGRYSAALLDIYFDYLLASRFDQFSSVSLKSFSRRFYRAMLHNYRYLPARIKRFMFHFIITGRLGQYATLAGIRRSLRIMVRARRMDIPVERAILYLNENEENLWLTFRSFSSELKALCDGYLRASDREAYLESLRPKAPESTPAADHSEG